jgi:hypothetical protein
MVINARGDETPFVFYPPWVVGHGILNAALPYYDLEDAYYEKVFVGTVAIAIVGGSILYFIL